MILATIPIRRGQPVVYEQTIQGPLSFNAIRLLVGSAGSTFKNQRGWWNGSIRPTLRRCRFRLTLNQDKTLLELPAGVVVMLGEGSRWETPIAIVVQSQQQLDVRLWSEDRRVWPQRNLRLAFMLVEG